MEISKSTPYVRYRENISSTLHKGTIHIESEYLDRERKTTIESIEGQTWQNMVNGENKEEDVLPRLGLKIGGNEDVLDTVEQHMPIDTIIGDVEPVANEDGTYTYEISTMEGSYAKTLNGENNFSLTSDGLVGDMYIKYNAQGEEVNGNIVMSKQSEYTIENSNTGEIKSAILKGRTLVNIVNNDNWESITTALYTQNINIKKGQTYTVVGKLENSDKIVNELPGLRICVGSDNSGTSLLFIQSENTFKQTFTNNENETIHLRFYNQKTNYKKLMIIEGDYTNVDIPYFEGMQSVQMPVLTTVGKNLLHSEVQVFNLNNYIRIGNDTSTPCDTELRPSTTYTLSWNGNNRDGKLRLYSNGVQTNSIDIKWWASSITFTTSETENGFAFYTQLVDDNSLTSDMSFNVQLEEGSVATPYEPYKSNILTVNEDVTLRSNGDIRDELNLLTGQLTQRIDENGEVLSQESVKTVDLTIKDQDDKIIQSLHTHPSTTHINLSSDGLIPSAELSYTMYGNIGETTGEKITDGTDSKLIEGKIYGDTLLNVLPSPSLKNSMDYSESMQKINNGYDNINVADGEFKKATLYGQTLVNLLDMNNLNQQDSTTYTVTLPFMVSEITIIATNKTVDSSPRVGLFTEDGTWSKNMDTSITNNKIHYKAESGLYVKELIFIINSTSNTSYSYVSVEQFREQGYVVIEGNYENSVPSYFEGMQSVVMPSLMTFNTCNIFNPNNVEYSGDDCLSLDYYPVTVGTKLSTTSLSKASIWTYLNLYDENKNIVKYFYGNSQAVEKTFVISDPNVKFVRFKCLKAHANETILSYGDVRPYEPYQPHQSNTLTTSEDVTLREVGNVRDELDCTTGVLTQRIGEVVLNGSENWTRDAVNQDVQTNTMMFQVNLADMKTLPESENLLDTVLKCDKMSVKSSDYLWTNDVEGVSKGLRLKTVRVRISKDKLSTQDINGLKQYLQSNPITVQYELETPTNKTVNLSITNQDNQPQTAFHSIANGYINTSSQGLLPKVDYEVPTSNSYYLDGIVKTNTQYTTKSSSDCNATIDGTSYPLSANGTFTTPSTITDNLMVLDTPVDDLMFIEGDLTGRELDYFTGLQSVDNIDLSVYPSNLDNINFMSMIEWENDESYLYRLPVKGKRIWYKTGNMWNYIRFYDKNKQFLGEETNQGMTGAYQFADLSNDVISKAVYFSISKKSPANGVQIMQLRTKNNLPDIPYTDNIVNLTTNEPIALHRIGDVKDELDLVNECVVRKTKCIVLDGSDDENWKFGEPTNSYGVTYFNYDVISNNIVGNSIPVLCDKFNYINIGIHTREKECIGIVSNSIRLVIKADRLSSVDIIGFRQWLTKNPVTVLYELATPTTEPVRIVPQNPKQSTVSLTLQSPLQKVGNVADQLRWNPYKGHYVRYNYIQDGVANNTYTFEDLKDMNERKFVNLYNQRTYIDTNHTIQVISHGLSRYCLAEQGKQYQVRWDWVEQPSVDTIKVDLCGNVKEIPSSGNSVIIDVEKFTHQFIQIQGLGLTGKITNLMVIETVNGEIPDVDFFSGIQCVGNTVQIDGNAKVQIDMEQTNGNLFDNTIEIYNKGNNIRFMLDMVRPNKTYTFKHGNSVITKTMKYNQKQFNESGQFGIQTSNNGSANVHFPIELCYADMAKDGIRPRYYDKESIILPMKLCRVGNIYDNLYYDDLKGYYRIQQSIGHKYFTGETTEVWTMETTNGYRTIKFTCTSANIDQIALGETICNSFKHLSTINDDIEGFIIYNGNFVLRVDKDRLTDRTVDGFKALLASSPIHLFYQLKTPQMINLTEYPNRIELNTYRDEIFTFFKGMNPTKFTLSVPMDKTYRYGIEEEGQGLANRVTVNNETISAENVVAVKEVIGQGIANIIEDVNNVVITPRPNHGAVATSHTLNNTKPATIRVHGFEPSGETAIGTYNTTDKAYQLKVMSSNGDNSLSDYYVLNVPYKLETYADGTKDMVYYDEAYKQWHFKGLSVKEYTVASDGTLGEVVEVFRGLAPRSGMIAEFKLMFTSGTTASRMYYSLNGTTYSYTSLRNMSDGNYLYVGIFNTGGTKIDIAYKTDPNAEYTNLSPLSTQVPECFMVNQIQSCTFCEVTLDKQYIYSEMNAPIELDTYDGSTKVFMDGNATDTNIIIRNECATKIVNTYTDTEYTVYWKYVDGLGNLRITLGGTTVEVDGKQEYATLKTQLNAPQELLYVGGYNLSIKDLMVVKGAKINDLPYFEGSRQIGTLVLDEEGNKSYKITLVQGGSVLEQRDENAITFKDDNKHNVVVHKIVGVCPTKVD